MKTRFSVEIDRYNGIALAHTLLEIGKNIPEFEYEWKTTVNAGGIDYGIYLNIDIEEKEVEICNQPEYGSDGDDMLNDVFEAINGNEDEDEDE